MTLHKPPKHTRIHDSPFFFSLIFTRYLANFVCVRINELIRTLFCLSHPFQRKIQVQIHVPILHKFKFMFYGYIQVLHVDQPNQGTPDLKLVDPRGELALNGPNLTQSERG